MLAKVRLTALVSVKSILHLLTIVTLFLVFIILNDYKLLTTFFYHEQVKYYILLWTPSNSVPFVYMGRGQEGFKSRNCTFTNCIVTSDRNILGDITKFDVIVFNGPDVRTYGPSKLPQTRSQHQKYVFASIESSQYYPLCNRRFNNYFNWTWTYRLDSDVRWGYLLIKDKKNNKIGPNRTMHWLKIEKMDSVGKALKEKFAMKSKAAAWFISNCHDISGRTAVAHNLKIEMEKYDLTLDIFGECGVLKCPSPEVKDCDKMLEENYYFFFAFENSFSEDYVTEKLITALKNDVVPIVYGGANYTRFMPDGIYLDAKTISAKKLAAKMDELINYPDKYADFFRWKNHYSYHSLHEDPETDEYCRMCAIINDEDKFKKTSIIKDFRKWWNNPEYCPKAYGPVKKFRKYGRH